MPAIQSVPVTPQVESQTEPLAALSVAPSSDLLYVGNVGNNSITVYKHDAQGNTAPIKVIAGSKTSITQPGQLSEDSSGNLYVGNGGYGATGSVLVFAHGANGNVAPIRKLGGPATHITAMGGMTVDKTTGKIFVVTEVPNPQPYSDDEALLRFPPNSTGNAPPFAFETVPLGSFLPPELASDSTGTNLLMSTEGTIGDAGLGDGIYTIPKQFPGNSVTTRVVYGPYVTGIADDPSAGSYVFSGSYESCNGANDFKTNSGIVRFPESAKGTTEVQGNLPCTFTLKPAPISVITSATDCGQLALGYLRNIYAVCGNAVKVYSHDSSGNVPPLRVLSGPATKMNQPYGIYEGK